MGNCVFILACGVFIFVFGLVLENKQVGTHDFGNWEKMGCGSWKREMGLEI